MSNQQYNPPFCIKAMQPGWGSGNSVRIGKFTSYDDAEKRAKELSAEFQEADWYVCDSGKDFWRPVKKFTYGEEAKL